MAAKHLEKVLAPFEAVHIETGLKKDIVRELNKRHDPNIGYSYKQELLNLLLFLFFF